MGGVAASDARQWTATEVMVGRGLGVPSQVPNLPTGLEGQRVEWLLLCYCENHISSLSQA